MDKVTQENLDYVADRIAQQIDQKRAAVAALPAAQTDPPSCGSQSVTNGCENLLYAQFTVEQFNRGGRTDLDQIVEGKIPVAPGSSVVLSQAPSPGWPTGCFVLRYRLANNGINHGNVKLEFFVDNVPLDRIHWGDDVYQLNNTLINEGKVPVPLARGKHCCLGANNRMRVRISHTGAENQIEDLRLYVEHGHAVECCSACASGHKCQSGCQNSARK